MTLPRGIPPERTPSRPLIPVFTTSWSGMPLLLGVGDGVPGGAGTRGPNTVDLRVRCPRSECAHQRHASVVARGGGEHGSQPPVVRRASEYIQASLMGRVRRALEGPRLHEHIQGPSDALHVIADKRSELLAGDEHAGVTVEEEQQVKVTGMTQ